MGKPLKDTHCEVISESNTPKLTLINGGNNVAQEEKKGIISIALDTTSKQIGEIIGGKNYDLAPEEIYSICAHLGIIKDEIALEIISILKAKLDHFGQGKERQRIRRELNFTRNQILNALKKGY